MKARPLRIVTDGTVDAKAMRRANISEEDLNEAIRMEQFESVDDVAMATLEGGGKLSVVPKRHLE